MEVVRVYVPVRYQPITSSIVHALVDVELTPINYRESSWRRSISAADKDGSKRIVKITKLNGA